MIRRLLAFLRRRCGCPACRVARGEFGAVDCIHVLASPWGVQVVFHADMLGPNVLTLSRPEARRLAAGIAAADDAAGALVGRN